MNIFQHSSPSLMVWIAGAMTAIMVSLLVAPPTVQPAATATFDPVDRYVDTFVRQNHIPGLALAIVQNDQVVHLQGFGMADPSGRPVTGQTPFEIGSVSKSFTALAVMQQVEAGKIDLDAPVKSYLPWFRIGEDSASDAITVRMLLNQTSGIPTAAGQSSLNSNDDRPDALEGQVRDLRRWPLAHLPGTAFLYANANYQVAGLLVQTVSGESYESYIQEHIFTPLDMHQSYTDKIPAQAGGLASGYHFWFGLPIPAGDTPYPHQELPSGFIISSAEDLGHALIAHLNQGAYQGKQVVSPASMEVLHRPALANYAMGWVVVNGVLSHNGAVADYGSYLLGDPVHKVGVAVLFNVNNAVGASHLYVVGDNVLAMLTQTYVVPTPPERDYTFLAVGLVFLLAVSTAWLMWWVIHMRRWWLRRNEQSLSARTAWLVSLPFLAELVISWVLLTQLTYGIWVGFLYQPDLTILITAISTLLVAGGIIRCGMTLFLLGKFLRYKSKIRLE
jgi:CubicO group peptidase (beta-lactamase class C family)